VRQRRTLIGRLLPAGTLDMARGFSDNARRYLLTAAFQNAGYGIIGTTFAIYLKDQGFSEAVVGDVEGALALAAAVVCLTLPPLVASVGYRRLMVLAGVALGLSRLGQAYAPTAIAIVGLGLLYGVGDGTMQSLSTAFLSENAGSGGRTRLFTADFVVKTGAMVAGALMGGIVPVVLRPMVGEQDAYQFTIVLAGLIMMASAVFAAGIKELPHRGARGITGWITTLRGFSSWGRVARLLVPEMLISLGAGLVIPFVALFLKHRLGATVTEVGVVQAVSSVAMAVAALATPRLAKRIGLAGTIVLTELVSLPFLLSIPFAQSLPVAAVLFWVRGMLMNMSWPIYNQLSMAGLPAVDKPLVAGWVRFGWSIAWLAGSSIGGRLMEQSYTTPYFYTAALYGAGAVATYVLLRRVSDNEELVTASGA